MLSLCHALPFCTHCRLRSAWTCTTSRATSRWRRAISLPTDSRPGRTSKGRSHAENCATTSRSIRAKRQASCQPDSQLLPTVRCTTAIRGSSISRLDQTEPAELRTALLTRGRERFDIHCSVCHGRTGDGDGMIVRRGFRKPPSLAHRAVAAMLRQVISSTSSPMASARCPVTPTGLTSPIAGRSWRMSGHYNSVKMPGLDDVPDDKRVRFLPSRAKSADRSPTRGERR